MHKLLLGIKRDWKKFFASIIFGYTFLWSLLEPTISFLKIDLYGWWKFLGLLILCLIIATIRVWPKSKIVIKLKNTNTKINIFFGDLFAQPQNIAVAVNEYFDSQLGKLVSPRSIHGILIEQVLGKQTILFDNCVDSELSGKHIEVVERPEGKHYRYQIGTTASLRFGDKNYLLFALCQTDSDYKASATPLMMMQALSGLWDKARVCCNGYPISLPLLGTGLAGIGLPAMSILQMILISILIAVKQKEITSEISIVLHKSVFDEVDLDLVECCWR